MRFGTFSYNQARPWVPEHQAFEELLEQIQLTERLGFDEAWFAEHHHSDYGMLASPNLIIAPTARPRPITLTMNNLSVLRATQHMLGLSSAFPFLGCASGRPPGDIGRCPVGSTTDVREAAHV